MSLIKTPAEIQDLREGGKILGRILSLLAAAVKPGITTGYLESLARDQIKKAGASPAFLGYTPGPGFTKYPAALCASLNDEVVHCIPNRSRVCGEGDVLSLDLGIKFKGLYTDAALTVPVGRVSDRAQSLIAVTRSALAEGIRQVKPGNRIGDVAVAISKVAKAHGFAVIRDLVGHGVGHEIHEKPAVPNYGRPGTLEKLEPGMVLAIEPMFTAGTHLIRILDDGWGIVTADGSLAVHFEHTVAVTENGCEILTAFQAE